MITFIHYPKCTTCKKAKKWLDDNGVSYEERDIKTDNPTVAELKEWHASSGRELKKFFNTSGMLYRDMQLKDRLPQMADGEMYDLLASDGMLVKRPLLIDTDGGHILTGFREAEWADALL